MDTLAPLELGMTTTEVARAAGVSYRQLDYWARTGALVPALVVASGSGSHRRYSTAQANVAAVLGRLSRLGATTSVMAEVAAQLLERTALPTLVAVEPDGTCHHDDLPPAGHPAWLVPVALEVAA